MIEITNFYKFVVIVILVCLLCILYTRINKETFVGYKQDIYMPKKKYERFINRAKPVSYQITLGNNSKDIILEINKQDIFEYLKYGAGRICIDKKDPINNKCEGNEKNLFENNNYVIKSLENLEDDKKKKYLFTILTKCTDESQKQYYIDYGKKIGMEFLTADNDILANNTNSLKIKNAGKNITKDEKYNIYNLKGELLGKLNTNSTTSTNLTFTGNIKKSVSKNDVLIFINDDENISYVTLEPKLVISKYIIRVFVNGKGPYKFEVEPSKLVETEDFYRFKYKPEFPSANYRFSVTAVNGFSEAGADKTEIESDKVEKEIDYNYADSVISNTQSLQTDVYCMPDGDHILKKRGGNIKKCQMNFPGVYAKDFEKDTFDKYKYSSFSQENYEKLMADITGENKLDYNIEFSIQ